ncbi:MAG: hypothetical protein ACI9J0_003965, partial [Cryomorphaceae bacterium]
KSSMTLRLGSVHKYIMGLNRNNFVSATYLGIS